LLFYMQQGYLFSDMKNVPQSLPKQLAIPMYDICKKLEIRKSLGYVHQMYNWKKIDPSKTHKNMANLALKYNWTGLKDEAVFHLVANLSDFSFGTIYKSIFEINKGIETGDKDTVIVNFKKVVEAWDEIIGNFKIMYEGNDPQNFFYKTRMYLTGFTNETLFPKKFLYEGVFDEKGNEIRVATEGGSVGCDPSFQLFERAFGIRFKGDIKVQQDALFEGITKPHKDLIKFLEKNSRIRQYVIWSKDLELIEGYNKAVSQCVRFNKLHIGYLEKYIVKAAKIPIENLKGQGNTPLSILYVKGDVVKQFLLQAMKIIR